LRALSRLARGDDAPEHAAGEKLFIEYAGDGVPIVVDRLTGESLRRRRKS